MALINKHRQPCGFDIDKSDYEKLRKLSYIVAAGNMARLLRLIVKRSLADQDAIIQEYYDGSPKVLSR